jgi:hypothetical protein
MVQLVEILVTILAFQKISLQVRLWVLVSAPPAVDERSSVSFFQKAGNLWGRE